MSGMFFVFFLLGAGPGGDGMESWDSEVGRSGAGRGGVGWESDHVCHVHEVHMIHKLNSFLFPFFLFRLVFTPFRVHANKKRSFRGTQFRAFADFVLGSLILHFFCVNFIN